MTRYRVVVADPAWRFDDSLPGPGRGAAKQYRTDSEAEIAGVLGVELAKLESSLANDAILVCWRVASQVPLAYRIARAWGFEDKSEIVWIKKTKHGRDHFGMGRTVRNSHETAIIATRGRPKIGSNSVRSWFEAPLVYKADGSIWHSAKPDRFYDLVEELAGRGPYLELFGRRQRDGWTVTGDEVPRVIAPRSRRPR